MRTPLSCAAAKIAIHSEIRAHSPQTHNFHVEKSEISLRSSIHAEKKIQWKLLSITQISASRVGHGTLCSVVEREPNRERSSPQQPERRLHDEKGFPREGVLRLVRVQAS